MGVFVFTDMKQIVDNLLHTIRGYRMLKVLTLLFSILMMSGSLLSWRNAWKDFIKMKICGSVYLAGLNERMGDLKVVKKFSIEKQMYEQAVIQGYVSHSISMVIKIKCFRTKSVCGPKLLGLSRR